MTQDIAGTAAGNNQNVGLQAYGDNRTIDNDITLNPNTASPTPQDALINFESAKDDASGGNTAHRTLTLNGTINVTQGAQMLLNNQTVSNLIGGNPVAIGLDGCGDVNLNGNILLNNASAKLFNWVRSIPPPPPLSSWVSRLLTAIF